MRFACLILLAWPSALLAQEPPPRGEITGTVYDSVARRPIADARVEAVDATMPSGTIRAVRTDGAGRYAIAVPPGRYIVGLAHEALDSLALDALTIVVEVTAGRSTRADLAVPSPARIVASVCRGTTADSVGLLIGQVRDAGSGGIRDTGRVHVTWVDVVIENLTVHSDPRSVYAHAGSDGWFAACLPGNAQVVVSAASRGDSSGKQLIDIPAHSVLRRDFFVGGTAVVRGMVRSDRNHPLADARVAFAGTPNEVVTDATGAYRISGPAGSQTLEARSLGHVAVRQALVLRSGVDTTIDMQLVRRERVLDTIRVVGQRIFDRDSDGFQQRRRGRIGRFWNADDIRRGRFWSIYDALRQSPSVTIHENGFDRSMTMRGGLGGRCQPTVFLNGLRLPADAAGDLDLLARPHEISGLELYTVAQLPPQFGGTGDGCGAVVIWTRPQPRPRP